MLPTAFLKSIQKAKGYSEAEFVQTHVQQKQVTSIRVNPEKKLTTPAFDNSENIPWCNYGFYLPERPLFTTDPNLHAGAYYVQDASSMFLWQVLQHTCNSNSAVKVLDVCAAPGGKSTLLNSFFTNALIVSNEVIKTRANILVENITKWGSQNVIVTNNDPQHFKQVENFFDVIVVDAPCSGSGLFRKDITAIKEWSEDNVALCSQRQQRIIADILPSLQQHGIFIYSTCSYQTEENEEIVDWLMQEFEVETIQIPLQKNWGIVETVSDKKQGFGYRFYPNKLKGEGFFIAAFKQKTVSPTNKRHKEFLLQKPAKPQMQFVESLLQMPENQLLFTHNNQFRLIHKQWETALKILAGTLYIKKAGLCLGELKGKDFVPSPEIAFTSLSLANVTSLELDKQNALQYLRKKQFEFNNVKLKGWVLIKYNGLGLGFIKALPNRVNNYYPQEWRILHV